MPLTLLTPVGGLAAQSVTGELADADTRTPVDGAYVVLLSSDFLELTRVLTNSLGRFTVRAPRSGSYRLRIERIGYRSTVSNPFTLAANDMLDMDLEVEPIFVELDALTIEGAQECRVIGDQALEVLTVWAEARKALTAVAYSAPREERVFEFERFERWFTPSFRMVHEIRETIPTYRVMPFRSRTVEELEELGYVVVLADSVLYEAPDAEVFFSAPFLQHHCFRLDERHTDGRRQFGLRFEPIEGRGTPDVKGVFWLDARTGALIRLELEYVNVGVWQRERGAAGELEFSRLHDGRWFVSRWWIRMPLIRQVETLAGPIWHMPEALVGFKEDGGDVVRVYGLDGRVEYAPGRATISGLVHDSTAGQALIDARVSLVGTDYFTTSDVGGSYWLTDLPSGRYSATFAHPRLTLFGLSSEAVERRVRLRDGMVTDVDLAVPSPPTIVSTVCRESAGASVGLIAGRVTDAEQETAIVGALVSLVWMVQSPAGVEPRELLAQTDTTGTYRACVPQEAALSVEVVAEGFQLSATPAVFGDKPLHVLHVALREVEAGFP